jgi:Leucine-rich repeat (LRR) protein
MSIGLRLPNACLEVLPDFSHTLLEEVDVQGNRLTGLDGLPLTLKRLNASQNHLVQDGIFLPFPSLETLEVSQNHLSIYEDDDFVMCFPSLKNLNVSHNLFRYTWFLRQSSVETLNVSHNRLQLVSGLPQTLKVLIADTNEINMVQSKLPPLLERIELSYNLLRFAGLSLNWPCTLRELHLNHNKIEKFPRRLPDSLEVLSLSENRLTELPPYLPASLHTFLVASNRIRHLPSYTNHKKFQVFLIHDNCLTDTPETYNAKLYTFHGNWQEQQHHEAQRMIRKCWKRYVFTLRLRHYKRTQKTKEELFVVSMMPERWEQVDSLDPVWLRRA